ncbi:hypothetical protein [Klebsiella oxytoca]|uniref:ParE family toxin-like protein n=1 Tax=Klebsiella oxytoca TaxID=571 RepID=UPI003D7320E1
MTHSRGEPKLSGFRIPRDVWIRAVAKLSEFMRGNKNYSRLTANGYLVIRMGNRWRILSKDNGNSWSIYTAERYSKEWRK